MNALIRPCGAAEVDEICAVINDAATAYRGIIAPDCWKEPYMPPGELRNEIGEGVIFWGAWEDEHLAAVMGLQKVGEVALIRHAYTRRASQGHGLGSALLQHLRDQTARPLLIGTWRAATWAVGFYERHGFQLVPMAQKDELLQRYWTVPSRQRAESVVLADACWFVAFQPER